MHSVHASKMIDIKRQYGYFWYFCLKNQPISAIISRNIDFQTLSLMLLWIKIKFAIQEHPQDDHILKSFISTYDGTKTQNWVQQLHRNKWSLHTFEIMPEDFLWCLICILFIFEEKISTYWNAGTNLRGLLK